MIVDLEKTSKTLMFADIAESVAHLESNEPDSVRVFREIVLHCTQQILPRFRGQLIDTAGDGMLCTFPRPDNAIECARAFHVACAHISKRESPDTGLKLRIGVHSAEVFSDQEHLYGFGVSLAARVAAFASPGTTAVTQEVRDEMTDGIHGVIEDHGECYLKHIAEPYRIYSVRETPPDLLSVGRGSLGSASFGHLPLLAIIPPTLHAENGDGRLLSQIIADCLISPLSKSPTLRLVSRLSAQVFSGREWTRQGIRDALGTRYLLTGSGITTSGTYLINWELTDLIANEAVLADSMRGDLRDLVQKDSDSILRFASRINSDLNARCVDLVLSRPIPQIEGATLLQSAINLMYRSASQPFQRARDILDHLIQRYPGHPAPHTWLANWYVLRATRGLSLDRMKDGQFALQSARAAIDLDGNNSLAFAVEGFVHCHLRRDLDRSEKSLIEAIELNPNESTAWLFKAAVHAFRDEGSDAVESSAKALALSPLDPNRHYFESLAASAALTNGDFKQAISLASNSIRLNASHASTYRTLAIAQALNGDVEASRLTAQKLLRIEPGLTVSGYLQRAPSANFRIGKLCAEGLRLAGVPD